ncbi:hypothetical protein ABZ299_27615 [Streptomyces sp. NPDC006184]|uniref:hypothetical protein n=1 Tax=Streptomyces sp. NPDC006184 TaxID=3155455 RepID=UPI0033B31526
MTPFEGIPVDPRSGSRALAWFTTCVGLLAIVVSVGLAVGGHAEAAVAVASVGAAVAGSGGTRVTVHVRR